MESLLRRPIVHQLVDYATGFAIAGAATRSPDRTLLALCAAAVIASTAMFAGPLAAFRVFPARAHRVVDVTLGVTGVALAVTVDSEPVTRLTLLAAAAVLVFMSVRFAHDVRAPRT
ncbi:MAG: hypothetical protein RLZZ305_595 [Actinomycetota bacterium]|jgi:hypothetical protein